MNSTSIEVTATQEIMIQEPDSQSHAELIRQLLDAELCAVGGGASDVVLG